MGNSETRPDYDCPPGGVKLKQSIFRRDLRADIPLSSLKNQVRSVVREENHILVDVQITFKLLDKGMFKTIVTYVTHRICIASLVSARVTYRDATKNLRAGDKDCA